jgi:hypothetical protein
MSTRKRKPEPPDEGPEPKTSGRQNYKYVGLPAALYDELKAKADADDRSVQWMARKAVRFYLDYLKAQGK